MTLVIALLSSAFSFAFTPDFMIKALGRSYPLAGGIMFNAGVGQHIWGNPKKAPLYGYIRPSASYIYSGQVDSTRAEIGVFPISFLGAKFGKARMNRRADLQAYDCDRYACQGTFDQTFQEYHVALKVKSIFGHYYTKLVKYTQRQNDPTFIDPENAIVIPREGGRLRIHNVTLGYKLNDRWSIVTNHNNVKLLSSVSGFSRMSLGGAMFSPSSRWQFLFAGGHFKSSEKQDGATVVTLITFKPKKGLALF